MELSNSQLLVPLSNLRVAEAPLHRRLAFCRLLAGTVVGDPTRLRTVALQFPEEDASVFGGQNSFWSFKMLKHPERFKAIGAIVSLIQLQKSVDSLDLLLELRAANQMTYWVRSFCGPILGYGGWGIRSNMFQQYVVAEG